MPAYTQRVLGHEGSRAQLNLYSSVTDLPRSSGTAQVSALVANGQVPPWFLCQRLGPLTSVPLGKPALPLWAMTGGLVPAFFLSPGMVASSSRASL